MEILLGIICVCLFVIAAVLLLKYCALKQNLRRFSQEMEKLKDSDYRQPLKVTDFDKDLALLAVKVNEHTDLQRKLGADYEQEKKRLGTVISGISHDFRTPLTASLGYLQMVEKSGELSPENAEYLHIAAEKNKYLKALSDEFFELTKLESGQETLYTEPISLSRCLTETVLEQHGWVSARRIAAQFDIAEDIVIEADQRCLTRILNNLMSNAEKYASDRFSVTLGREGAQTVLRVSNTLADSTDVDISRVFEPFYRMRARTESGSGLGLYVVRQLCERQGWQAAASLENNVFTAEIRI